MYGNYATVCGVLRLYNAIMQATCVIAVSAGATMWRIDLAKGVRIGEPHFKREGQTHATVHNASGRSGGVRRPCSLHWDGVLLLALIGTSSVISIATVAVIFRAIMGVF
jgi:hypothetical protein